MRRPIWWNLVQPEKWRYQVSSSTKKQFQILKKLMEQDDVESIVEATDIEREGELIFRLVYHRCGCKKPFERLWISSMEGIAIRQGFAHLKPGSEYDALYEAVQMGPPQNRRFCGERSSSRMSKFSTLTGNEEYKIRNDEGAIYGVWDTSQQAKTGSSASPGNPVLSICEYKCIACCFIANLLAPDFDV